MFSKIHIWWDETCRQFFYSETILWGRIQMVAGAVWAVLVTSDLSPVISGKWLTYWLVFSGVVTEILRRRGTETAANGKLVDNR